MTEGIRATLYEPGHDESDCLLIGAMVPRIHHTWVMPVYLVAEHADGCPVVFRDKSVKKLVCYPSAWPGPAQRNPDAYVYVRHADLPFDAPLPVYDLEPAWLTT